MKLQILRCGWCGCFCDNTGRVFEATRQLVAADETVGFDDAQGECNSCILEPTIKEKIDEILYSKTLEGIRSRANKYMSTGQYE